MKLFEEHRASSFNEPDDKSLTKSKPLSISSSNFPLLGVANTSVASSYSSTANPDNHELPDSLLQVLDYVKGKYEVGPPIYLGDDPEPEGTVYDTTVNPLPLSPAKPIPGHIPRHERTQIQLPCSRKSGSLPSPKEEDNQISSLVSTDSGSSSRQIGDEERAPNPYLVASDSNPGTSTEDFPQSCSSSKVGEPNFMMLNARRLKEFLTKNVDEHATNLL